MTRRSSDQIRLLTGLGALGLVLWARRNVNKKEGRTAEARRSPAFSENRGPSAPAPGTPEPGPRAPGGLSTPSEVANAGIVARADCSGFRWQQGQSSWEPATHAAMEILEGVQFSDPDDARVLVWTVWNSLFPWCPWPPAKASPRGMSTEDVVLLGRTWEEIVLETRDAISLFARTGAAPGPLSEARLRVLARATLGLSPTLE